MVMGECLDCSVYICFILETAVQDDKVMQDFESELFLMGGDRSQKVKAPPIRSYYGSKDCVNLSSSTAVSRFMILAMTLAVILV